MAVIQPRADNVVQPKIDFELIDNGQRLVYKAKTQHKGRVGPHILLLVVLGLLALCGGIAGLAGLFIPSEYHPERPFWFGTIGTIVAILSVLGIVRSYRWVNADKVQAITFDKDTITFDGNSYLLDHVSSLGWRSGGGLSGGGTGLQGAAAMIAVQYVDTFSGQVYMRYGADEIVIIKDLNPRETKAVYDKIAGFLGKFGHKFESH